MNLDELSPQVQTQAKVYALQSMFAALLVRHLEKSKNIETEAAALMEIAMGSIGKFDLRGENQEITQDAARALMEAFATETITAASHSAHLRNK